MTSYDTHQRLAKLLTCTGCFLRYYVTHAETRTGVFRCVRCAK